MTQDAVRGAAGRARQVCCRLVVVVVFLSAATVAASAAAVEPSATLQHQYVFTDGQAVIRIQRPGKNVTGTLRTITAEGIGRAVPLTLTPKDGRVTVAPRAEGIHIVTLQLDKPVELRFLAISPPEPVDRRAVLRALPRTGAKLLSGKAYLGVAMGDSVAHTGDYEGMLAMLLQRATGNPNVRILDCTYPGRSVDAAVRNFRDDVTARGADLGLLMYGMNDQGGGCSLEGYLAQYRWIAEHLAADGNADAVFCQPTPHIAIPVRPADRTDRSKPPHFAFRTIGFAESLRPLATELKVPLAETFQAIWGPGGATIEESVLRMWPRYPTHYNSQMTSKLETDGKGDTIHPNALGHLAMAKAAFRAMTGLPGPANPLRFSAFSELGSEGIVSRVKITNVSGAVREGRIAVYPLSEGGPVKLIGNGRYKLAPGKTFAYSVVWPKVKRPRDLLEYPSNHYLAPGVAMIATVDYAKGATRVYGVPAPFVTDTFVRGRKVVTGNVVRVSLGRGKPRQVRVVAIPVGVEIGRIPLIQRVTHDGRTGWAVAELAFVRYGQARKGEAVLDGKLDEWAGHTWSTVGLPVQARWTGGIEDNRAEPNECYLLWAFKAGKTGLFVAVRATGTIDRDRFTMFFDPREPKRLGTPGRYYWLGGSFPKPGRLRLSRGETSRAAKGLKGVRAKTPDGSAIEMFVPYELMELSAWPRSGDLGVSIWWTHNGPGGKTSLLWSEDGHPWNPRWYGVVRLQTSKAKPLPYMVRIK